MKIHSLVQGSPEWLAYRAQHFNASDAPAMMGVSEYKTRTQLLHEMHTGIAPEVDAGTQRRFDEGHRIEALARPLAEAIIGEDLYPVTGSEGKLSASFDGLTMAEDTGFEHKTLNDNLRACMRDEGNGYDLPMQYQIQMEQQLMVSGAERILFMASKWVGDEPAEELHCWYASDPKLRSDILQGWTQFAIDLAAYVPTEVVAQVVGRTPEALPALTIIMKGEVSASNLDEFKQVALAAIRSVNRDLKTDQDFADSAKARKWCEDIETRVAAAKDHALGQTKTIDDLFRAMDEISVEARDVRLALEKLEKARKESRRGEIVAGGVKALADHVNALNTRIGKVYMPISTMGADFGGAIKGLRTFDSMQNAVDTTLANAKIAASAIADKIQANLATLRELASAHAFLFADVSTIVLKAPEDLTMLVKSRISEHQAAEDKKAEDLRESIRKEEAEKLAKERRERRADIVAISGWYGNFCNTLETVESGLQKVAAWTASPTVWGDMVDDATAEVEKQREGLTVRRDFLLAQQAEAAKLVTHEAVVEIMMPTTVIAAMNPAPALVQKAPAAIEKVAPMVIRAALATTTRAPATPPELKLGQMAERLGFTLTAAFLLELGFEHSATDKAAKLYHESEWPLICAALVERINAACELQAA